MKITGILPLRRSPEFVARRTKKALKTAIDRKSQSPLRNLPFTKTRYSPRNLCEGSTLREISMQSSVFSTASVRSEAR